MPQSVSWKVPENVKNAPLTGNRKPLKKPYGTQENDGQKSPGKSTEKTGQNRQKWGIKLNHGRGSNINCKWTDWQQNHNYSCDAYWEICNKLCCTWTWKCSWYCIKSNRNCALWKCRHGNGSLSYNAQWSTQSENATKKEMNNFTKGNVGFIHYSHALYGSSYRKKLRRGTKKDTLRYKTWIISVVYGIKIKWKQLLQSSARANSVGAMDQRKKERVDMGGVEMKQVRINIWAEAINGVNKNMNRFDADEYKLKQSQKWRRKLTSLHPPSQKKRIAPGMKIGRSKFAIWKYWKSAKTYTK